LLVFAFAHCSSLFLLPGYAWDTQECGCHFVTMSTKVPWQGRTKQRWKEQVLMALELLKIIKPFFGLLLLMVNFMR
jgi:hypothetical protein